MAFNLMFVVLFNIMFSLFWWFLIWGALLFVKEKYGDFIWKTLKRYELVADTAEKFPKLANPETTKTGSDSPPPLDLNNTKPSETYNKEHEKVE